MWIVSKDEIFRFLPKITWVWPNFRLWMSSSGPDRANLFKTLKIKKRNKCVPNANNFVMARFGPKFGLLMVLRRFVMSLKMSRFSVSYIDHVWYAHYLVCMTRMTLSCSHYAVIFHRSKSSCLTARILDFSKFPIWIAPWYFHSYDSQSDLNSMMMILVSFMLSPGRSILPLLPHSAVMYFLNICTWYRSIRTVLSSSEASSRFRFYVDKCIIVNTLYGFRRPFRQLDSWRKSAFISLKFCLGYPQNWLFSGNFTIFSSKLLKGSDIGIVLWWTSSGKSSLTG